MGKYAEQKLNSLKDEIAGHVTLTILALLGLGLYSLSYSLIYAANSSSHIVAVLEMWMVSSHLIIPIVSLCIQGFSVAMFHIKSPVPHVASAQTTIFLAIAILCTYLGLSCVREGDKYCKSFFGAAALPKFSAVGTFTWAWIMFVSSLGCQTWGGGGFSIGLSDIGCLFIACILVLIPTSIISKLYTTCDRQNIILNFFCNGNSLLCENWMISIIIFISILLFCSGYTLKYEKDNDLLIGLSVALRFFGIVMILSCNVIYIFLLNQMDFSNYLISMLFSLFSLTVTFFSKSIFKNIFENFKQNTKIVQKQKSKFTFNPFNLKQHNLEEKEQLLHRS